MCARCPVEFRDPITGALFREHPDGSRETDGTVLPAFITLAGPGVLDTHLVPLVQWDERRVVWIDPDPLPVR